MLAKKNVKLAAAGGIGILTAVLFGIYELNEGGLAALDALLAVGGAGAAAAAVAWATGLVGKKDESKA